MMTHQDKQYRAFMGAALGILVLIALASILGGCSSAKKSTAVTPQTIVEVENSTEREVIREQRIDTVYVTIPNQTAERTTLDSISHLETEYALSNARINADGTLFHSIANKLTAHPVAVTSSADTIKITQTVEKAVPYPVTQTVTVERNFTWWEQTRLKTWWWLLAIIAVGAAAQILLKKLTIR
jgi:hypothetical protein